MSKFFAVMKIRDHPKRAVFSSVGEKICVSLNTAYKWSSRGEPWFPRSIRLANGAKRVRRDWYEEWLEGMEAAANR